MNNDVQLSLLYSLADIYVIPSIQDNLPNTVIESLSCGTPVIGFDVGGINDLIRDGINGYIVPKFDTRVLYKKIEMLLDDDNERNIMGQEF